MHLDEDIEALMQFGFTLLQARVYLTLLKIGDSSIRRIAEKMDIARQEAQRVAAELMVMGFLEKILAKPTIYRPLPINEALSLLFEHRQKQSTELAQKANILLRNLADVQATGRQRENNADFIIIDGKENIIRKSFQIEDKTRKTQDLIYGPEANIMHSSFIFEDETKKTLKRKVRMRMLIPLPRDQANEAFLKRFGLVNRYYEVRLLASPLPLIMAIFDSKEMILQTSPEKKIGEAPLLWTDNPGLLLIAQGYFDQLWAQARKIEPIPKSILNQNE
jgi:sugar-specific transcriptional regulator TrmB